MAIQVLQRVGPNCDRKRLLCGIARPGIRFMRMPMLMAMVIVVPRDIGKQYIAGEGP